MDSEMAIKHQLLHLCLKLSISLGSQIIGYLCLTPALSHVIGEKLTMMGAWSSSGDVAAFETLNAELGDKNADKKLYRLAKVRRGRTKTWIKWSVSRLNYEEGKMLVEETLIKQRWQPYFHKLLKK